MLSGDSWWSNKKTVLKIKVICTLFNKAEYYAFLTIDHFFTYIQCEKIEVIVCGRTNFKHHASTLEHGNYKTT